MLGKKEIYFHPSNINWRWKSFTRLLYSGEILSFKTEIQRRAILVLLIFIVSCVGKDSSVINIAVASNMKPVFEEIVTAFMSETSDPRIELICASSGLLYAQISEGAPFCIFISADTAYTKELHTRGIASLPKVYAKGPLVLWTNRSDIKPNLNSLLSDEVKHIAIPNPELAPYGISAVRVLERSGLLNHLKHKLVYGENVSQTNHLVASGAVEIGFTSPSIKLQQRNAFFFTFSDTICSALEHAAIVNQTVKLDMSQVKLRDSFYQFLFSPASRQILRKHGYLVD